MAQKKRNLTGPIWMFDYFRPKSPLLEQTVKTHRTENSEETEYKKPSIHLNKNIPIEPQCTHKNDERAT